MPISLILTPFDHFHFRQTLAVKCIPDLRVCLTNTLTQTTDNLKSRVASASKKLKVDWMDSWTGWTGFYLEAGWQKLRDRETAGLR